MKFSIPFFIMQIFLVLVAVLIAIPSLNVNIFGKNLQFHGVDSASLTGGMLKNFYFEHTRDFVDQKVYTLDFTDLNSTGSTIENKEEVYSKNFDIVKKRLDIIQPYNYDIQQFKTEDGKYFAEAYFVNDDSEFSNIINTIIAKGDVYIFEDDPEYIQSEEMDPNANFLLEGKRPSKTLSMNDIVRVGHYLDTIQDASNEYTSVYVVQLDFGVNNIDKVSQAASHLKSSKAMEFMRGIQLIQNGMPIGGQLGPIRDASQGGQSYIKFAPSFAMASIFGVS